MTLKDDVLDMKEEVNKMKKQSFAMELLSDQRKQNKRLYTIILVILAMWFATIGYLVYVLNDIGVIEETSVTQDNENGYNNYIGNDGEIINGKTDN